jgi:pimeloyl-ACP methyl ester carboxylesterase
MHKAVAVRIAEAPLAHGCGATRAVRWACKLGLAFAALAGLPPGIRAQNGPQLLTFVSEADGTQQPYALYLPPAYDKTRKYPLVVSLHSEESTHRLNFRQLFGAAAPFSRVDPLDPRFYPVSRDVEFIVAFPLARGSVGYRGIAENDVYQMLAEVENHFPIDRDRVYLTGISMGGGGALWYALTRPDVWAAVAPLAPIAPPGTESLALNAFNLPVRLFQGLEDPIVSAESSRDLHRRFQDAGVAARYFEFPGVRHDIWNAAYKNGSIFDWFGREKRNRYPERVRFVTESYRYCSAYWVRIDGLRPGTQASIDARWNGASQIAVVAKNVDGFTLTPERLPASVSIDGAVLRIGAGGPLSFTFANGRWRAGLFVPSGKRAGAEGPISAAFAGGQIYVYGEGAAAFAEHAAKWSTLSFRVLADSAVTPADLADSDAILFGTAGTNSLIARFAGKFPITLNAGAADYGLLFIAPIGPHYAVVSSGLPWWTGAAETTRGGDRFAPEPYRLLSTFGDYILFKGSLANVVAEGRFDSNWKVPPEAAAKMRATGTVTIR